MELKISGLPLLKSFTDNKQATEYLFSNTQLCSTATTAGIASLRWEKKKALPRRALEYVKRSRNYSFCLDLRWCRRFCCRVQTIWWYSLITKLYTSVWTDQLCPWRRTQQPITVFLPGESPWTEEPGGLQSMGSQRVRHDWATKHSTAQMVIFLIDWFVFYSSSHTQSSFPK